MPAGAAYPDAAGAQPPAVVAVALWATKPVGPPRLDQIVEARVLVVESAVDCAWGARIVAWFSAAHASILHLVAC